MRYKTFGRKVLSLKSVHLINFIAVRQERALKCQTFNTANRQTAQKPPSFSTHYFFNLSLKNLSFYLDEYAKKLIFM